MVQPMRIAAISFGFFVLALTLSACGKPKAVVTTAAVDEFVESYQSAYEASTREPLMMLIHWAEVPPELRDFTKDQVYPFKGQREIRSITANPLGEGSFAPLQHEGQELVPNLLPAYELEIIFESEQRGGIPERYRILVGELDGELRLCAWCPAD